MKKKSSLRSKSNQVLCWEWVLNTQLCNKEGFSLFFYWSVGKSLLMFSVIG
jgi:hypothetical protein